jgi:hypothetical protein
VRAPGAERLARVGVETPYGTVIVVM